VARIDWEGKMKAILCTKYGSPDALELQDVEKPTPEESRVLVKVYAASLNIADWYDLQGGFSRFLRGFQRPKDSRVGRDFAGTVEAVGSQVTQFKPGDEVFGVCPGSFAEYATARQDRIALKPANCSFEAVAAVPVAGLTALQGLRDAGHIQAAQKVLIDGASGGVGTFAVQIAKSSGAEVTAVVSTRSVEVARSIGADHVIDYTREDFALNGQHYDLIFGVNGKRSIFAYRGALNPAGVYVMAGASGKYVLFAFMQMSLLGRLLSREAGPQLRFMGITQINQPDLLYMAGLLEAHKVVPTIDKRYPLHQVADAFRYLAEGHTRGKVIVSLE
jgi:NADPH:quinone reductase-like Zn-dependent oxidoreductase